MAYNSHPSAPQERDTNIHSGQRERTKRKDKNGKKNGRQEREEGNIYETQKGNGETLSNRNPKVDLEVSRQGNIY